MSTELPGSLRKSIRRHYGLIVESAASIGTGAMSTTLKLITDQATLFMKVYPSRRSAQAAPPMSHVRIAFAHAVQRFLHQGGFPTPCLLLNSAEETFSVCDHQIYALSEFIRGSDYRPRSIAQLRTSGETLGLLHQRLRGFQPAAEPSWRPMIVEILAQLGDRFSRIQNAVGKSERDAVSKSQIDGWRGEVHALRNTFADADAGTTQEWTIHGDYRAQNLKFEGEAVCAVLDLDAARPANRLYDLAYAMTFFPAVYQNTPLPPRLQSVFLHAYERICPLSDSERKMLPGHLRLAFLRGLTLWLDLYYFADMRERTRPWIEGYIGMDFACG